MRKAIERVIARGLSRVPGPLLLRLVREKPRVIDGNTLDPHVQLGLALEARRGATPVYEHTPAVARRLVAARFAVLDVDREPVEHVRDDRAVVDGRAPVPVRVYRPRRCGRGMLVFFHGGGGVIGSVDAYDTIARYLANRARVVVVSVDYRLAPEYPFPAGIEDAVTGYLWARERAADLGVDPARIAVGGDSMGGNFAAEVCLRCAARGLPMPAYQWLIYPGTDFTRTSTSHRSFAHGFILDQPLMDWFIEQYLDGHDEADPEVSPLHAELAGLPPALVVTAGFDPLRDEGRAYTERLRAAGVDATYVCQPGLVHGFVQMGGAIATARRAIDDAARWLRAALG